VAVERIEHLMAIIEREDDGYVALCPELDIASQGHLVEEASRNHREALFLVIETASPSELKERLHSEVYVTTSTSRLGRLRRLSGHQVS
jgi:predicted RNase H-like HicB family nuclease